MRTKLWRAILGLALCCGTGATPAMTVEVRGNQVFATGDVGDDLVRFEQAFAKPGVDTVVFVDSAGGSLWTALRVGRLIEQKGYRTVVAGRCYSACALMFLGGRERRFSNAYPARDTLVGLHGGHDMHTGQIVTAIQTEIFAYLRQRLGGRFHSAIINQALYDMDDATAMLIVPDPVRPAQKAPVHCRSAQRPRSECTTHAAETAITLGIATHDDLVELDLPAALRPTRTLAGRELPVAPQDMAALLGAIARRHCGTDSCRADLTLFARRDEHRAMAADVAGGQLVWVHKMPSRELALLASVYVCNHRGGPPARLCEVEMVDEHPIRPWYAESEESHRAALAKLTVPAERFHAGEQFGGLFTQASGLRTDRLEDSTPRRVDGVETLGTQDLARMLLSASRPVLVDVDALTDTIPGAVVLRGGGHAYADAAKDAELALRIGRLMALLAPDKGAPVVFFASGRDSWSAVNAALRARTLGYTRVLWYRGGLAAWQGAALPTALGVVRAVAD